MVQTNGGKQALLGITQPPEIEVSRRNLLASATTLAAAYRPVSRSVSPSDCREPVLYDQSVDQEVLLHVGTFQAQTGVIFRLKRSMSAAGLPAFCSTQLSQKHPGKPISQRIRLLHMYTRGLSCRQRPEATVPAVTKRGDFLRQQPQLNLQAGLIHGLQLLCKSSRSYDSTRPKWTSC